MRVRVLLFAGLRERLGRAEVGIELPAPASVGDVLAAVERELTGVKDQRFVTALNQRYVERDAAVSEGDELALIPPVSGG